MPVNQLMILVGTLGLLFLFAGLMTRVIAVIRTRRVNTELWCTIFEGFTQGAIRLDDLKNPESVIEKKVKRDGRDRDSFDPEWQFRNRSPGPRDGEGQR